MEQLANDIGGEKAAKAYLRSIAGDCLSEIKVMEELKGITQIFSIEDYYLESDESRPAWTLYIRMEYLTPFSKYCEEKELTEKDHYLLRRSNGYAYRLSAGRSHLKKRRTPRNTE